ncbi:MAG: hypothetical protein HDP34_04520 [Clostridia bacterium]|nr:hypothetical protein [Clostridia bacterium]
MNGVNTLIALDREDMSEFERGMFLKDLKRVCDEYFECDGELGLEVTRADGGFLVCVIFSARRIKNVKNPV